MGKIVFVLLFFSPCINLFSQSNVSIHISKKIDSISLDFKFISATKLGQEITGFAKILKKTKTMVFLICHLKSEDKIVASASGIWKILNK